MAEEPKLLSDETLSPRSLLALAALSIAVGAFSGLVAASFRLLLQSAYGWRTYFILRAHDRGLLGFLWVNSEHCSACIPRCMASRSLCS